MMESGSFLVAGGAAYDTYAIYNDLVADGYCVDIYGNYKGFDKPLKSATIEEMMETDYSLVWLNSIRDFPFAQKYHARHRSTKFLYIDRGGILTNFKNAGLKKLLPKMLTRQYLITRARQWLDYYVAISASQITDATPFFNGTRTRLIYIPIAPHDHFRKIKMKKDYHGAIAPARLDERQKKISFMIRGVAHLLKSNKQLETKELLKIIGTGRDEQNYRKLACELGVQNNVKFYKLSGKQLIKEYNNSGFLVSTSEWESFGRTYLEAMACGLPILINEKINTIVNINPEERIVRSGYNGLVYNYGDLDSFASNFLKLYSDKRLRDKMAANSYKYVQKFSFKKVMQRYKELIEEAAIS